jgi:hypothetical protein
MKCGFYLNQLELLHGALSQNPFVSDTWLLSHQENRSYETTQDIWTRTLLHSLLRLKQSKASASEGKRIEELELRIQQLRIQLKDI